MRKAHRRRNFRVGVHDPVGLHIDGGEADLNTLGTDFEVDTGLHHGGGVLGGGHCGAFAVTRPVFNSARSRCSFATSKPSGVSPFSKSSSVRATTATTLNSS